MKSSIAMRAVVTSALIWSVPVRAEETATAEGDRTYAPSDIIVTAKAKGYAVGDGSTAMKTPTALIDTPQTVQVITRDQLDDQNVHQLSEALQYVAGIALATGEGHRDEVYIRGQRTTADFFLNGLRDDAQYYRPLYNVERVEVLKGANALTFGRGGGGGVINRVSKSADLAHAFVRGNGSLDTFGATTLAADVNQPLGEGVALRVNGAYETFANHRDFYDGHFLGIAPTLTVQPAPGTRLVVDYSHDSDRRLTDRGVPSLAGTPLRGYNRTLFGDRHFNRSRADADIARVRLDQQLADGLTFNVTGQFASYDKAYANLTPASTNGQTVTINGYRDATRRKNWVGQANLVWQGKTGAVGHTLLAGVESARQTTRGDRQNAVIGNASSVTVPLARVLTLPVVSLGPTNRDRYSRVNVFAAYLQDQIELGELVQLIGGVRYERFDLDTLDRLTSREIDRTDSRWSPRFGVVVKPAPGLSVYASYTESFLPQSGDQFLTIAANAATLDPEKFASRELGVKWAPRPDLLVSGAVFRLDRSNTQAPDPAGSGLVVLAGKSRIEGFEAQLSGNITDAWHASFGYTYLDGKIRATTSSAVAGTRLPQVPRHHLTAWTRYDFSDRIGLGGGVVSSAKQYASLTNNVVLPAYTRVDVAAYWTPIERVSVQVNVQNLFDKRYWASAHNDNNIQPAEPLSASVGVSLRF